MKYIFLSLEFNIANKSNNTKINDLFEEVIVLSAVMLDEDFEKVSDFYSLVKPVINKEINPYLISLARIQSKDVWRADYFDRVTKNFRYWVGDDDFTIYIWNQSHCDALIKNYKIYNVHPKCYYWVRNVVALQDIAESVYKTEFEDGIIGFDKMLKYYNIPMNRRRHKKTNDAEYLSEIFIEMNNRLNNEDISKLYERKTNYIKLLPQTYNNCTYDYNDED